MYGYHPGDVTDIGPTPFLVTSVGAAMPDLLARARIRGSVEPFCESPIEADLATLLVDKFLRFPDLKFIVCSQTELDAVRQADFHVVLVPQYKWKRWRMDFAIVFDNPERVIFIECDGLTFHSTPKQLANDRAKDGAAAADGIPLLRFPGSDLWKYKDGTFGLILSQMLLMMRGGL